MDIDVKDIDLSSPHIYRDGSVSAYFYIPNIETCKLIFEITENEDGTVLIEPSKVMCNNNVLNVGKKIKIEIVSNGYIVQTNSETIIVTSDYDLQELVKKLSRYAEFYEAPYDSDIHDFTNVDRMIVEIKEIMDNKKNGE